MKLLHLIFSVIDSHWSSILHLLDCAIGGWGEAEKREFSTKVLQLLLDCVAANDLDRWEVCTLFSLSLV